MRPLNLCRLDRIVRVTAGVIVAAATGLGLHGAFAVAAGIVAALLVLSGSMGFCHVYKVCGLSTRTSDREDADGNR